LLVKFRAESLQRKLLYNKVQELKGNIRVFARCRYDNREPCVFQFPTTTEVIVPSLQTSSGAPKLLEFERVFSTSSTQEEVFIDTKSTILSVIDGYNVCIIAYGQTGSGKTYTMMGTKENPGVNRRAIHELLGLVQETSSNVEYAINVSLLEAWLSFA
jgi:kinesin family protein C2/C3